MSYQKLSSPITTLRGIKFSVHRNPALCGGHAWVELDNGVRVSIVPDALQQYSDYMDPRFNYFSMLAIGLTEDENPGRFNVNSFPGEELLDLLRELASLPIRDLCETDLP